MPDIKEPDMDSGVELALTGGARRPGDDTQGHDRGGVLSIAAEACIEKGNFDEAESLYLQAIAAREKSYGMVHRKLVPLLNSLAKLYTTTSKYAEAERIFNRALDILQSCPKESKAREIETLTNFSAMLRKAGRTLEAEHVESCCETAKREEDQAPLLVKLARGLTPSTSIDVRDFGKWLDEAAAAQPGTDGTSAAQLKVLSEQIQVSHRPSQKKPLNWRLPLLGLLVLAWILWLAYFIGIMR